MITFLYIYMFIRVSCCQLLEMAQVKAFPPQKKKNMQGKNEKTTKRHRSIPGKNTSSIESYFCSMKAAFQCATCFRYLHQLAPPQPACALTSALEVSLWTLPKWPKMGGPPAEPSIWNWMDSLPGTDVTVTVETKLFTSNFIRHIYQNLISHDLSSIHISIHGT